MKRLKEYYNRQIEKMGKKQKVTFYTAAVVLALLVLLNIGGLAYAFFTATVIGNDTAKGDVVETGTLSIVYTNGQELRGENVLPGWSETKTFTVENTGTVEATYNINWENITNTFVNKTDLVYTLTSTNSGGTLSETQIPNSGEHIGILSNIKIQPGVTQTYTLTVTYKNRDADQSSDMGKSLIGKIEVRDANEVIELETGKATDVIISKVANNTNGLIKLNQPETEQTPELVEYRYSGSNEKVKNYVSFNNETWRIIGVSPVDDGTGKYENRLKIIREESIGGYSWDTSDNSINVACGSNQWGESGSYEGADLMRLLNPGYEDKSINNSLYYNRTSGECYTSALDTSQACDFSSIGLTEEAKSMIGNAKWYTAVPINSSRTTQESYIDERGTEVGTSDYGIEITKTTSWIGKVGLMYPSDYGYASSGCREGEQILNDYDNETCTSTNWLYKNINEWTLTPYVEFGNTVGYVFRDGNVNKITACSPHVIRPVTYLTSDVKIVDGDGTLENMYILEK